MFSLASLEALVGMLLHSVLPQNHLSAETKGAVNLGTGIIGTMAALVLGRLVASAKGSYDTQSLRHAPIALDGRS